VTSVKSVLPTCSSFCYVFVAKKNVLEPEFQQKVWWNVQWLHMFGIHCSGLMDLVARKQVM